METRVDIGFAESTCGYAALKIINLVKSGGYAKREF